MIKTELPFKFINTDITCFAPIQATGEAAGLDLPSSENYTLEPNEIRIISTNIAVEIPYGYEGQIRGRSGLAFKNNVFCTHIGTIDSDYRGEVKVLLHNQSKEPFKIKAGDRVAQMIISKVEYVTPVKKQELSDTLRGEGGFGSTGVNSIFDSGVIAGQVVGKFVTEKNKEITKEKIVKILDDCFEMLKKKNADYADYNVGPFSNFENVTKLDLDVKDSFFVRMTDKVSRIVNLLNKEPTLKSETLIDTCMDLINYLVLYETYLSGVRTNDEFLKAIKNRFNSIRMILIYHEEIFSDILYMVNDYEDIGKLEGIENFLFLPLTEMKNKNSSIMIGIDNSTILIKMLIQIILNKTKQK